MKKVETEKKEQILELMEAELTELDRMKCRVNKMSKIITSRC